MKNAEVREVKLLDNVRNQIAFCEILFGSCLTGNGVVIELTKKYGEDVSSYNLERYIPKDFNFLEFKKGLASVQKMNAYQGCRKGGWHL